MSERVLVLLFCFDLNLFKYDNCYLAIKHLSSCISMLFHEFTNELLVHVVVLILLPLN